jgi:hypothetical protein
MHCGKWIALYITMRLFQRSILVCIFTVIPALSTGYSYSVSTHKTVVDALCIKTEFAFDVLQVVAATLSSET